jgi:hypothetical protein
MEKEKKAIKEGRREFEEGKKGLQARIVELEREAGRRKEGEALAPSEVSPFYPSLFPPSSPVPASFLLPIPSLSYLLPPLLCFSF